jgi:hypothetical protein
VSNDPNRDERVLEVLKLQQAELRKLRTSNDTLEDTQRRAAEMFRERATMHHQSAAGCAAQRRKYERAAQHPWDYVPPDPPSEPYRSAPPATRMPVQANPSPSGPR